MSIARQEIRLMAAGPELDALVAELVMGWRRGPHAWWCEPGGRTTERCEASDDYYHPADAWSPSGDIAAAWQVVEAVQQAHPAWRFSLCDVAHRVWHAEFFGEQDPEKDYGQRHGDQTADSAPLAVCRAALEAVVCGAKALAVS